MSKKTLMLMILDGWGLNPHSNEKNAILDAHPENFLELIKKYPHSQLKASGEAVGLPEGQMGNSEVGHLNIGAGRVIYQPLVEITKDIRDGDFFKKPELVEAFEYAKKTGKSIHFGGLLSDGGVHSHINHLFGLLEMAKKYNLEKVYIHAFMDGRDTAPTSGLGFMKELQDKIEEIGVGKVATVSGRYYAMDRDNNWDRIEKAYDVMVGKNVTSMATTAEEAIENSYSQEKTDEFILPTLVDCEGTLKSGDVFINFNFRPDRARQITRAINDEDFKGFQRDYLGIKYYCMRQYDSTIKAPIVYHDKEIVNTLGEVLAKHNLTQLRTAETEKYAHVTFFFNGGKETQFPGEDRVLVASPKVATYDLQPEMSAPELMEKTLEAIDSEKYDVIIINFANPDMVGHTGNFEATKKAIKTVDKAVGEISKKILEKNGTLLITADHGNAEKMVDPETGAMFTAHTTNEVPFIMVSQDVKGSLENGKLADIAPTMLEILNIEKPVEMTGNSLLKK
ncbi:2,3-bisphosphoglycerate-independent phosphoglycerate mutase [Cetobacterium sp. SF1]|uniref:2,3-bisphosphoglycerate-independent phosphoglycerate mutase n=1 Tax=Cetobacterium sp. SF1 TaxID=3417654 RepID=UPI003CEC68D6